MGKSDSEAVTVVVRCRPLNETETKNGNTQCVEMDVPKGVVAIRNPTSLPTDPAKMFTFDAVYDWNSKQSDLYTETFSDLVDSVLQGFNGTIFAYGQTGTGKTYTMEGPKNDIQEMGVIPRSFQHIFEHITNSRDLQFLVRASYLEIYKEEIRDLLAKNQQQCLEIKERPDTGVYVKDLSSFVCKSKSEIEHVMSVGNQNRSVGATNMNEHSSRSHAIFIITVECSDAGDPEANKAAHIRVGKLNLVDLAGSERQAKTGATGDRLKEATKINLSLYALGNVISSLVDGKSTHVPYRDSKLTRLLQDSLGGNAKTVMVSNIGPADYNYEETLTTLRYANRAKNIKNKPKINEDPKDALLREFQEEISRLKAQLSGRKSAKRSRSHKTSVESLDQSMTKSEMMSQSAEENLEQKLAIEKELIEGDTTLLEEEKSKMLKQLAQKEAILQREREEKGKILAQIETLQSKLLHGDGSNMVEHTNEQQKALEKQRADLAERRKRERIAAQQLEAKEEQGVELEKTYSSLQQEVEMKTKKLRKLFSKLQTIKQDIVDVTEEYNRDRRDLEQTQHELLKELKLKCLLIDNFIPTNDKEKIIGRVHYDEEEDAWLLLNPSSGVGTLNKRPVSAAGHRRPVSEYARMLSSMNANGGSRYRGENIMRLHLDASGRTTRDYEGPSIAPKVQAALDAAMLNVEPDIELDVSALNSKMAVRGMRSSKNRTKPEEQPTNGGGRVSYPASRGLVPK